MPNYKAHLAVGFLTYVGVINLIPSHYYATDMIADGLLLCLIGSLFPDVDVKSNGQKIFYSLLAVLMIHLVMLKAWFWLSLVALMAIVPLLVRHRGIFHNILFLLFLGLLFALGAQCFTYDRMSLILCNSLFFTVGCVSHVLLDRFVSFIKRLF